MDPNLDWQLLAKSFIAGDWNRVQQHAQSLLEWLDCHRVSRATETYWTLWNHFAVRAVCQAALAHVATLSPPGAQSDSCRRDL